MKSCPSGFITRTISSSAVALDSLVPSLCSAKHDTTTAMEPSATSGSAVASPTRSSARSDTIAAPPSSCPQSSRGLRESIDLPQPPSPPVTAARNYGGKAVGGPDIKHCNILTAEIDKRPQM
eukprot:CAMPEP_0206292376 /NCGR_PEP_ID=MMETSP0106_2-20121207/3595_1 /ASSEMBLY_ACC=CAM_ASM_000206 /TAXON_ID=81532 /ORGANISM="Acanthoeca-like sp., Strain 10tr" /LENGTH=121 /DNA_ID=CAMNT_0053722949 /DNA_START=477 /DNA_END=843 /DNA_ORIENTATION=+